MIEIKIRRQRRQEDLVIDSLRQKFENRPAFVPSRRFKTSPDKPAANPYLSPNIQRILRKYETISLGRALESVPDGASRLIRMKNSGSENRQKKRWSQIQKEQYDLIKSEFLTNKKTNHSPDLNCTRENQASIQFKSREIQRSLCLEKGQVSTAMPSVSQLRDKLFADRLRFDAKGSAISDLITRKKTQEQVAKPQSNVLTRPFNFSLKLPSLKPPSEQEKTENEDNADGIEAAEAEQDIFCRRNLRKSQLKQQASKMGELSVVVKRRRVKTIDYQHTHQAPITPWNMTNGGVGSSFY